MVHEPGRDGRLLITADGRDIEAFVYGDGGETLIWAAGNGRPAIQTQAFAEDLATSGLRVVIYNYRQLGASTGPIEGITLLDYAADVWVIADALKVQKVHLVGKSFGNRVMRAASQSRPERVATIVLLGAGGEIPPPPDVAELFRRQREPTISNAEWLDLQARLNYAPGKEHLAALDAEHGEFPAISAAQAKSSGATPPEKWLPGGTAPMMVVTGLLDLVAVPQNAFNLALLRPNTWLAGLPDCGHNMINECPDDLRRLIVGFIAARAEDIAKAA